MSPPVPAISIMMGALLNVDQRPCPYASLARKTNTGMNTQPIIVTTQNEEIDTTLKFRCHWRLVSSLGWNFVDGRVDLL